MTPPFGAPLQGIQVITVTKCVVPDEMVFGLGEHLHNKRIRTETYEVNCLRSVKQRGIYNAAIIEPNHNSLPDHDATYKKMYHDRQMQFKNLSGSCVY